MQIAASDVAEALLEITGDALMSNDFDAFASVFHVPQIMATMAGPIHMESLADMERVFRKMCEHFEAINVTKMIRTCTAAAYKSPSRIDSTHVTQLWQNGKRLTDPYPVFSTLEKVDGDWKVTRSEYAVEPLSGQALAIKQADALHRPGRN